MSTLPPTREIMIIRGKNVVEGSSKYDVLRLFEYIDGLEELLDEFDLDDTFGTEGWRHRLGLAD